MREAERNLDASDAIESLRWYQTAVFYGIDIPAFRNGNRDGVGDLAGVIEALDYLRWLGITAIWLLPFYPSPRRDNGYDIVDYVDIDPRLGSLDGIRRLVDAAHQRAIRIVVDLVLNHSSDEHPWFIDARQSPDSPFRDYYLWTDDPAGQAPRENVFPGDESGIWTRGPGDTAWYLHHFYSFEPDLNHDNPAVRREMRNIVEFWLDFGIDGFLRRCGAFPGR